MNARNDILALNKAQKAEDIRQKAEKITSAYCLLPLLSVVSGSILEDFSAVFGRVAQFFVNPQELIVLADTVGAAGRASLDLADAGGDRQVGDGGVFGLAGAVAHHGGVAAAMRQGDGV